MFPTKSKFISGLLAMLGYTDYLKKKKNTYMLQTII